MMQNLTVKFNDWMVPEVTGRDCSCAAWHFRTFGYQTPPGFWTTVRDLMLAGA